MTGKMFQIKEGWRKRNEPEIGVWVEWREGGRQRKTEGDQDRDRASENKHECVHMEVVKKRERMNDNEWCQWEVNLDRGCIRVFPVVYLSWQFL